MLRVRITYTKSGALRYTSNLDMQRIWERMLRRARLPLAYSQGFHPQARINQASPLPLGMVSWAEMVEVWFEEDLELEHIRTSLQVAATPGLDLLEVQAVDLRAPSLPTLVLASEYRVTLRETLPPADLNGAVQTLLNAPSLPRERRGKEYDLRPLVQALELLPAEAPSNAGLRLAMRLTSREGATGRPDEVLYALQLDPNAALIERTGLILSE